MAFLETGVADLGVVACLAFDLGVAAGEAAAAGWDPVDCLDFFAIAWMWLWIRTREGLIPPRGYGITAFLTLLAALITCPSVQIFETGGRAWRFIVRSQG